MENKITSLADLQSTIIQLEAKQAEDIIALREEFGVFFESFNPLNVLQSTITNINEDELSDSIGPTIGYLTKKIMVGKTDNPLKIFLGSALQLGVSMLVSKNSETLNVLSKTVMNLFKRSKKKKVIHSDY